MLESALDPKQEVNFLIDNDTTIAIATTVYIIKDGKVLLMNQTKPHTVVDKYYVGIGGKTPIRTYLNEDKEKVRQDVISFIYDKWKVWNTRTNGGFSG